MRYALPVLALLSVMAAEPARAEALTFEILGTVTANNLLQAPWNSVPVGAAAKVVYTFDPMTPDSNGSATQGDYLGAISALTVTLGSVTESATSGNIRTTNMSGPFAMDNYRSEAALTAGIDFSVQLLSMDCGPLGTDGLPTHVDVSQWSNPHGELCNYSVGRCVSITWTTARILRCDGDANDDGSVTFADVTSVLANFSSDCD